MIEGKRLAIIIGVDKYFHESASLPTLEGVKYDVNELYDKLKNPDIGSFEIYSDNYIFGSDATYERIRQAISDVFWKTGHEYDLVLFYFSGHGVRDGYGNGYIVPYDMLPDEPFVRGIKMQEIVEMASKSKEIKAAVMILDCCYSGIATEGTKTLNLQPSSKEEFRETIQLQARGRVILASGGKDKTSREVSPCVHPSNITPHAHGHFTLKLIEALDGGAADDDGYITLNSLNNYLTTNLKKEYLPKYEKGSVDLIQIAMSDKIHNERVAALELEIEQSIGRGTTQACHSAAQRIIELEKISPRNANVKKSKDTITKILSQYNQKISDWLTEKESLVSSKIDGNYSDLFDLEDFLVFEKFYQMNALNVCFLNSICETLAMGKGDDYFIKRYNACFRTWGKTQNQKLVERSK